MGEDEKALCDHQQRLRLLGIDEWSEDGLKSVDYRESMALNKEVHHLILCYVCIILKGAFLGTFFPVLDDQDALGPGFGYKGAPGYNRGVDGG